MHTKQYKTTGSKFIAIRRQRFDRVGLYAHVDYPQITFAGKWLKDLGFHTDNRVELLYGPGVVVVATQPIAAPIRKKIEELIATIPEPHPNPEPEAITTTPPTPPAPCRIMPLFSPSNSGDAYPRSA